jgi:hypothetical protein
MVLKIQIVLLWVHPEDVPRERCYPLATLRDIIEKNKMLLYVT